MTSVGQITELSWHKRTVSRPSIGRRNAQLDSLAALAEKTQHGTRQTSTPSYNPP